jgi:hypothetical protein
MLDLVDAVGHLGYCFLYLANVMIVRGKQVGWILRFQGELIWVVLGIYMGLTSIWMWGILFMIVDAWGFFKWRNTPNLERIVAESTSVSDVEKST